MSDAAPTPETDAPTDAAAPGGCGIVWSDDLCEYDFGPYHPMSPVRLTLTRELARCAGVFDRPGVRTIEPVIATDEQLGAVHDADYIAAVRAASAPRGNRGHAGDQEGERDLGHDGDQEGEVDRGHDGDEAGEGDDGHEEDAQFEDLIRFGIGGDDVPAFPGMHTASARIAGGSIAAVDAIRAGQVRRAVNIAGGLHHARPASASGFCVYNDAAIAIRHALEQGEERVMYVDVDVHHGDGVELALWDEPRAVTLSVHETGERLFPGSGFVQDTGGTGARGSAINVPLPPRTTADGWVRAIRATVPALVRAVKPTLLVTQHGADTHRVDPLADFSVTLEAHREVMVMLRELADEVCDGRWLALGGGGYAVIDVVPRSWAQLLAVASGEAIDPNTPLPLSYLEAEARARGEHGLSPEPAIRIYGDGRALAVRDWEHGFDPEDALDRAIQAARRGAFPEWGLDPFVD